MIVTHCLDFQGGAGGSREDAAKAQEEQKKQIEDMKNSILSQCLTQEARARREWQICIAHAFFVPGGRWKGIQFQISLAGNFFKLLQMFDSSHLSVSSKWKFLIGCCRILTKKVFFWYLIHNSRSKMYQTRVKRSMQNCASKVNAVTSCVQFYLQPLLAKPGLPLEECTNDSFWIHAEYFLGPGISRRDL